MMQMNRLVGGIKRGWGWEVCGNGRAGWGVRIAIEDEYSDPVEMRARAKEGAQDGSFHRHPFLFFGGGSPLHEDVEGQSVARVGGWAAPSRPAAAGCRCRYAQLQSGRAWCLVQSLQVSQCHGVTVCTVGAKQDPRRGSVICFIIFCLHFHGRMSRIDGREISSEPSALTRLTTTSLFGSGAFRKQAKKKRKKKKKKKKRNKEKPAPMMKLVHAQQQIAPVQTRWRLQFYRVCTTAASECSPAWLIIRHPRWPAGTVRSTRHLDSPGFPGFPASRLWPWVLGFGLSTFIFDARNHSQHLNLANAILCSAAVHNIRYLRLACLVPCTRHPFQRPACAAKPKHDSSLKLKLYLRVDRFSYCSNRFLSFFLFTWPQALPFVAAPMPAASLLLHV